MKAISLWQPWASLIACGAKRYETRDWPPPSKLIGQRIAIHAAKKIDKEAAGLAEQLLYTQRGGRLSNELYASIKGTPDRLMGKFGMAHMPIGCVVCTAVLVAAFQLGEQAEGTVVPAASVICVMARRPFPPCFTVRYDNFGNYAPGRWAWLLDDVQVLHPPPAAKGERKFFELPQGWMVS